MLDIRFVRSNIDALRESIEARNMRIDLDRLRLLAQEYGQLNHRVDLLREARNDTQAAIRGASQSDLEDLIAKGSKIKAEIAGLEPHRRELEEALHREARRLPNLLHPEVPRGVDERHNRELRRTGAPTSFNFNPKDHVELGSLLDILDFDRAARVSGSKFYYLKNEGVLLELALTRYALDLLRRRGFSIMITPDIARSEVADGLGFNPRGPERNIYTIEGEETCLIGTAEITLGGYHAGEVLKAEALPLRLGGLSHCFRREAGAAGRSGKGLYRVHQFSKVEMMIFCRPEDSERLHGELVEIEEEIFGGLEIPYRVVEVCSGDLGMPAWRKFDLEAWMPGRGDGGDWGEVTSASNCTDYQARRLAIRYREGARLGLVHMLNGTAVAVSRAIIALVENHQQHDGSVIIPAALRPYTGFDRIDPADGSPS